MTITILLALLQKVLHSANNKQGQTNYDLGPPDQKIKHLIHFSLLDKL